MLDKHIWPAPAKLNLFLHITGRRDDGYHLLQTVFQFLDYSDELCFDVNDSGEITRLSDNAGIAEDDDLVVRAARLLQKEAGITQGVCIDLRKQLPMGGGVGGGSSDAATTLVALNFLWNTKQSLEQLAHMGMQLGADVPVFVKGYAAFAEGVGEKLSAIELPQPWFLVVKPDVHVATAEIFTNSQLTRNCSAIRICDLKSGVTSIADLTNVCEPIVIQQYPEIQAVINHLNQFGQARMTGTGACVFVAFSEAKDAEQALQTLPEKWQGFVARGLNQSPLHVKLETLQQENC